MIFKRNFNCPAPRIAKAGLGVEVDGRRGSRRGEGTHILRPRGSPKNIKNSSINIDHYLKYIIYRNLFLTLNQCYVFLTSTMLLNFDYFFVSPIKEPR
jgi:hypothetical protein